jgi:hypothetical protein
MPFDKESAKQILAQINRDELAQLGCDLTSIPSTTGQEKAIAEFILNGFATKTLDASHGTDECDRENVEDNRRGRTWGSEFEEKYVYNSPTGLLYPKVTSAASKAERLIGLITSRSVRDLRPGPDAAAGPAGDDQV